MCVHTCCAYAQEVIVTWNASSAWVCLEACGSRRAVLARSIGYIFMSVWASGVLLGWRWSAGEA